MRTIGIRASPHEITFAIFDLEKCQVINIEEIKVPTALSVPEGLKFLRSNLLDVLREYSVQLAGIRVTESNARSPNIRRIQIEGVVQETFASSDVEAYYIGQIASISSRIGIERTRFKPVVEGANDLNVEGWDGLSKEAREAVLCAIGARNA